MPPRIHVHPAEALLSADAHLTLPPGAARHVQVLRLQPGSALVLFDGTGGEWAASVERMGKHDVDVRVASRDEVSRELGIDVCIALGMPANERMDGVVEKCTELGAMGFVPLMTERSVLRLQGDRAERKLDHWAGVARAACEQSGRTRVPQVQPVQTLEAWLRSLPATKYDAAEARYVLSLRDARPLSERLATRVAAGRPPSSITLLSGPEGGWAEAEEAAARSAGFEPVSLGGRVLRADTAPMAALSIMADRLSTGA